MPPCLQLNDYHKLTTPAYTEQIHDFAMDVSGVRETGYRLGFKTGHILVFCNAQFEKLLSAGNGHE